MDGKTLGGSTILKLLATFLLILAAASAAWAQSAPDFALPDVVNGRQYTLSQFRGKVVLLNFFTFLCAPCRAEMPQLNQMDQEFKSQGFQTIGIGLASEPAQLRSLAQQLGLNYPVLAGTAEVGKAYGNVEMVPTTFIIDRQGNIAHKILGARSKEEFVKLIRSLL
jgi:cytochrome c biogenesis protein CcmG/thiol:disulfide interchange protein DsbE